MLQRASKSLAWAWASARRKTLVAVSTVIGPRAVPRLSANTPKRSPARSATVTAIPPVARSPVLMRISHLLRSWPRHEGIQYCVSRLHRPRDFPAPSLQRQTHHYLSYVSRSSEQTMRTTSASAGLGSSSSKLNHSKEKPHIFRRVVRRKFLDTGILWYNKRRKFGA